MSMSRACHTIEILPAEWWCVVASNEYDYDYAGGHSAYGPEPTAELAWAAMARHESNPGQEMLVPHDEVGDWHRELIKAAHKPMEVRR